MDNLIPGIADGFDIVAEALDGVARADSQRDTSQQKQSHTTDHLKSPYVFPVGSHPVEWRLCLSPS